MYEIIPKIPWAYGDVEILILYGEKETTKELHKRIPGRSLESIRAKRHSLGIKPPTPKKHIPKPFLMGGYIQLRIEGKTIQLHRIIMGKHLGRKLRRDEVVHHIDGDKLNNDIKNLYLCKDRKTHRKIHGSISRIYKPLMKDGIIFFDSKTEKYIYESKQE